MNFDVYTLILKFFFFFFFENLCRYHQLSKNAYDMCGAIDHQKSCPLHCVYSLHIIQSAQIGLPNMKGVSSN